MKRHFLLLMWITCFVVDVNSQTYSGTIYKYDNSSSSVKFEMKVPASWIALPTTGRTGLLATFSDTNYLPNTKNKNCLDSTIYQLKYINGDLSKAMSELGFLEKGNGLYMIEMNGFISIVVAFENKVNNYVGLDCAFSTNAICPGGKVKKGAAEMRYLLFSNGKETVCLLNNGVALSDIASKELINSFKFN